MPSSCPRRRSSPCCKTRLWAQVGTANLTFSACDFIAAAAAASSSVAAPALLGARLWVKPLGQATHFLPSFLLSLFLFGTVLFFFPHVPNPSQPATCRLHGILFLPMRLPEPGCRRPRPFQSSRAKQEGPPFGERGVCAWLVDSCSALGTRQPTPFQRCCVPAALQGSDVMGLAETGSGKTFGVRAAPVATAFRGSVWRVRTHPHAHSRACRSRTRGRPSAPLSAPKWSA